MRNSTSSSRGWVLGLAALASFMVALDALVVTTALSGSIGLLVAARAVQGVGAAAVMPLALTLVSAAFPPEQRGRTLGILGGLMGLAVASGPLIGGAVVNGLAWSWIFWINVPIGFVCVPLVLRRIPESRAPRAALDPAGLSTGTLAALGLVWALSRGNVAGWGSAEVLGGFVVAVAGLVAFMAIERRVPEPMLPPAFFGSRAFSAGNAAGALMVAALYGAVFLMAQYLQTVLGASPLVTGVELLPWTATPLLIAPGAGAAADRLGARPLLAAGLALQALGLAWVGLEAGVGTSYGALVPGLIVAGVGVSMGLPSAQSAVIGAVPPAAVGKASGINSTARQLGGVFGIAVAVAVFAGAGSLASPHAFADGFTPALLASAGLSVLGCVAALVLPGARPVREVAMAPAAS